MDKALKNFRSRAEERNRAIGGTNVEGFVRLRDREDKGMFPDSGKIRMSKGEIKEVSEEGNTFLT